MFAWSCIVNFNSTMLRASIEPLRRILVVEIQHGRRGNWQNMRSGEVMLFDRLHIRSYIFHWCCRILQCVCCAKILHSFLCPVRSVWWRSLKGCVTAAALNAIIWSRSMKTILKLGGSRGWNVFTGVLHLFNFYWLNLSSSCFIGLLKCTMLGLIIHKMKPMS